jgi:hypothetical protein
MELAKGSKLAVILLTVTAIALAGISFAALTTNQNIPSTGTVIAGPDIAIYSNSGCTTPVNAINWGSVEPGGSTSQTIYVEDTGSLSMTLSITVSNWNPSTAGSYITVTWNGKGQTIQPGVSGAYAVTLTLTVSPSITAVTSFSNSIMISGTG